MENKNEFEKMYGETSIYGNKNERQDEAKDETKDIQKPIEPQTINNEYQMDRTYEQPQETINNPSYEQPQEEISKPSYEQNHEFVKLASYEQEQESSKSYDTSFDTSRKEINDEPIEASYEQHEQSYQQLKESYPQSEVPYTQDKIDYTQKQISYPQNNQSYEQPLNIENNSNKINFQETIKTDKIKKKLSSFKKAIALACVVSLMGGGAIGGSYASVTYIMNYNNNARAAVATEETVPANINLSKEIPTESENIQSSTTELFLENDKNNTSSNNYGTGYSQLIKDVEASVVSIIATVQATNIYGQQQTQGGSGSGIIFFESETKYYIVTNNHVIEGSNEMTVSISGSDPILANKAGTDPSNDLAIIYVTKSDVKAAGINEVKIANFGNSDDMQVGDIVLAIGNAFGEGVIPTDGIISSKSKTITFENGVSLEMMQTNAAINKGNSGGALINLKGEVIGINTAKYMELTSEGMGYSIPSNKAKPIMQNMIDSINKPYIGINLSTFSAELATQYNLPSAGAYIENVVIDSPAERAGLKLYDIITGFNDKPILSAQDLIDAVSASQIGDEVKLNVLRVSQSGSESIEVVIKLEKRL